MAQLKTARLTDADIGNTIDNALGAAEQDVATILGCPVNTDLPQLFSADAFGLKKVLFKDLGGLPGSNGELARNASMLQYHNGGGIVKNFPASEVNTTEPLVQNDATERNLYTHAIEAGFLGSNGMVEGGAAVYVSSILPGTTLHIKLYFGSANFFLLPILNATGVLQGNFGAFLTFRVHNRNGPTNQFAVGAGEIPAQAGLLHVGTPNFFRNSFISGISINTTLAQNLAVNVVWGDASVSNSCLGAGFNMLRLR